MNPNHYYPTIWHNLKCVSLSDEGILVTNEKKRSAMFVPWTEIIDNFDHLTTSPIKLGEIETLICQGHCAESAD